MMPDQECIVGGDARQDYAWQVAIAQAVNNLLKYFHVEAPSVWLRTFCDCSGELCEI
jgi:hypothetical protein